MGKKIIEIVKRMVSELLDLIYPPENNCIVCLKEDFIGICEECLYKIRRVSNNDNIISYGYYGGVLKKLILEFKYKKNFLSGEILGEFLCELIEENKIEVDLILYVPTSKTAMKRRGFNQCKFIAQITSHKLNIPISHDLVKVKETREQKTLSKEERMINLYNVFDIKNKSNIKSKRIILIDDVTTTGSTLRECEKILKKYGASTIKMLTVAKSDI